MSMQVPVVACGRADRSSRTNCILIAGHVLGDVV